MLQEQVESHRATDRVSGVGEPWVTEAVHRKEAVDGGHHTLCDGLHRHRVLRNRSVRTVPGEIPPEHVELVGQESGHLLPQFSDRRSQRRTDDEERARAVRGQLDG